MRSLKPWAYGPFELLLHAEMHYRIGEDFDRRIAMVGYDNAIEVAITTYLQLHPIQRGEREYSKEEVAKWLTNYHTKIAFLLIECTTRGVTLCAGKAEIVWYHDVRNGQYHVGGATVPQRRELDGVRQAAIEIFGLLFEEQDVDALLDAYVATQHQASPPPRDDDTDRLIDSMYGMIDVCGRPEYFSDVLYALDPVRYQEEGLRLTAVEPDPDGVEMEE